MDAGTIERIESASERGASALFAGAIAYAAYMLLGTAGLQPELGFVAGVLAYLPCSRLLAAAGRRSDGFALADFRAPDFGFAEPPEELLLTERLSQPELLLTERVRQPELVLTDADRVGAAIPLVLDDILEEIAPDSRVVRLFDRKAMPTPGQLRSRITRHFEDGTPQYAPPPSPAHSDASQALSAALAELRRSLR